MKGSLATLGQLFGRLQDNATMINLIGPMRVFRGDAVTYLLTVTDDEDDPVDITGMAIAFTVKRSLTDTVALIGKSVGSGVTLLTQSGDTLGQATIELSSDDTDETPGLCYVDVVVTDGGDRQHVIEPREFTIGVTVNPVIA